MHFAYTYDGTSIRVYVNGVQSGAAQVDTRPMPALTAAPIVGRLAVLTGNFVGTMDEIAFYDHALAPVRVKAHFDAAQP